ncbi:hypothetical protein EVAR_72194_1 [Eumeta japonica]|uniref:Uncharacterized protein n=1 Tax=Eumeta variegata TaxID=151549 RepID=A0A4C1S8N8_EUMVA|nr:hypothetical protein EVAR_72194_1 [Eumeta japonica]
MDVADICKRILLGENQIDIANKIDEMKSQTKFEDLVDTFLNKTSINEFSILAEQQKSLFPIWEKQRAELRVKVEKEIDEKERKERIEVMEKEIATKKELLWFFDNEEKLDLEIYKKQELCPKRVFGKNKPSTDDEHYVPPEIRRAN